MPEAGQGVLRGSPSLQRPRSHAKEALMSWLIQVLGCLDSRIPWTNSKTTTTTTTTNTTTMTGGGLIDSVGWNPRPATHCFQYCCRPFHSNVRVNQKRFRVRNSDRSALHSSLRPEYLGKVAREYHKNRNCPALYSLVFPATRRHRHHRLAFRWRRRCHEN